MTLDEQFDDDDDVVMLCPACGDNYLHIPKVGVGTGKNYTEITSSGTDVCKKKPNGFPRVYRGTVVVLTVRCETCLQSHHIIFRFHKGQIVIENEETSTEEWDIWRD
jgi:hypothetical protein